MKENKLTLAAREYANTNGNGSGLAEEDFLEGSVWLLDQYNGLSPDTVKEMYEALKELWEHTKLNDDVAMNGSYASDSLFGKVNTAITKAEQELKK